MRGYLLVCVLFVFCLGFLFASCLCFVRVLFGLCYLNFIKVIITNENRRDLFVSCLFCFFVCLFFFSGCLDFVVIVIITL